MLLHLHMYKLFYATSWKAPTNLIYTHNFIFLLSKNNNYYIESKVARKHVPRLETSFDDSKVSLPSLSLSIFVRFWKFEWIENCLCMRKICYEQLIKYQKQNSKRWQCSQTRNIIDGYKLTFYGIIWQCTLLYATIS